MLNSSGVQARQPVLWSGGAFLGFLRQLYHTHKIRFVTQKGVVIAITKRGGGEWGVSKRCLEFEKW